jgi:outer membrane protein OmpA-like peptidoglycan-associated protein
MVDSSSSQPSSAPVAAATAPTTYVFAVSRDPAGAVSLSGAVPSEEGRAALAKLTGATGEGLSVDAALPASLVADASAGIAAAQGLAEGTVGYDGQRWWLTGKADTAADRDAAVAALQALPDAAGWSSDIGVLPPLDACRNKVGSVAARNAILFAAGKATLTDGSKGALDAIAQDLAICPDAIVHVQGHTDADGAADVNLVLSVTRAEAVVNALIERGVALDRLYAEGYGESQPIAPNDTPAGKQKNRRIAFEIDAPN